MAALKMIIPVAMAVLAAIGVLYYFGEREPMVVLHDEGIQIKCLLGCRIPFADITGITLHEQSMMKLGIGQVSFGYGMKACKGHFQAGLLYVRPEETPTLQIDRGGRSSVFVSFHERERTQSLYEALMERHVTGG